MNFRNYRLNFIRRDLRSSVALRNSIDLKWNQICSSNPENCYEFLFSDRFKILTKLSAITQSCTYIFYHPYCMYTDYENNILHYDIYFVFFNESTKSNYFNPDLPIRLYVKFD